MISHATTALAVVVQEALARDLQNFMARLARNLVRLASGHETLLIVIFILLVLMYLYLQKA